MGKHDKKQETKIIRLKDYQEPQGPSIEPPVAEYEYDEGPGEAGGPAAKKKEAFRLPKAVYQISLALLAVVLGLSLWLNREYLTWDNLKEWVSVQLRGPEGGDGYPVQITGTDVYGSNFLAYGGSAVTLSNTALTVTNSNGKEELSVRHNLNQPILRAAGGKYLMYNAGSTGYSLVSGGKEVVEAAASHDILTACVAPNGKFALGLESSYGASRLEVYMGDGSLQYEYPFSNDYITAVAMNYDGTFGAVCTARSEKGEMVSRLTVLDFSKPEPVAQFETRGNLLWGAAWGENGVIYGVGDAALVTGSSSDFVFSEYDYQGRQLTAFALGAGRAFLSISAYEHGGASTLLVFNGSQAYGEDNPVRAELDSRIEAISLSGGTVAALAGGQAVFWDYSTGVELGRTEAGADAKSIALASERRAYVLGVSEIRVAEIS